MIFPYTLRPADPEVADLAAHEADTANPHSVTASQAGAVALATYDANTVLAATSDNTPAAVTIAEDRVLGRLTGGNITALTGAQVAALMTLGDLSDVGTATPTSGHHLVGNGSAWVSAAQTANLPEPGGTADAGKVPVATGTGQASTWTTLTTVDTTAIHKATAAEISALTEETSPAATDVVILESAANSYAKRFAQLANLVMNPGPQLFAFYGDDTGAHRSTTSTVTIGSFAWRPATYHARWTHIRVVALLSATAAGAEPVNVNLIRTQLFGGSEGSGTELAVFSSSSIAGGTGAWSVVTTSIARTSLSGSDRHYSIQLTRGGGTGSVLCQSLVTYLTNAAG